MIGVLAFGLVYVLCGWITPIPSERVYYAWPLAYGVTRFFSPRAQPQSRRKWIWLISLLVCGAIIIVMDFFVLRTPFHPGDISRVAYCVLGLGLVIRLLKSSWFRLVRGILPSNALNRVRYRLPATVVWLVLLAVLLQPYLMSYMQVHPLKRRLTTDPMDLLRMAFEPISFRSHDGTILRGWWIPSVQSCRTAIACHGVMDTREGALGFAEILHNGEFNVLVFDFRGHGESGGWTVTYGSREKDDVIAAMDFVERRYPFAAGRFVGVGSSMGAVSLIMAAAEDSRLKVLHVDAPYASTREMAQKMALPFHPAFRPWAFYAGMVWGSLESGADFFHLSAADVVARISPRPILITHGTVDRTVPFEQGRRVYESAGKPKSFYSVEGADHCETLVRDPKYAERMLRFLNESLTDPKN